MTTPCVILSSLKNEDTGIDISVPRFHEEEAPLGGTSILYEISVLTKLDLFKTRLHKDEDIVHFTLFKAYREIEEMYNKLNKKFPHANLPSIVKATSKEDDKVCSLDSLMNAISKNSEVCCSSIFTQFIGVNLKSTNLNFTKFASPDENETAENATSEKTQMGGKDMNSSKDTSKLKSKEIDKSLPQVPKNLDLFDEVKHSIDSSYSGTSTKKNVSSGLFDDLEDDSLFTVSPPKKPDPPKPEKPVERAKVESKKPEKSKTDKSKLFEETVDDSEIIIKNRKPGEVSLFSEQDLGEFITKEEEPLFMVTAPAEKKKNPILSPENKILSPESDKSSNVDLDELLAFEPLPNLVKKDEVDKSDEASDLNSNTQTSTIVPPKPVPLPRKKSLGNIDAESVQRPQVMPRKVFLSKGDESKSQASTKPTVPAKPSNPPPPIRAKPTLPPKPKPAPKKPASDAQENSKVNLDSDNADTFINMPIGRNMEDFDILKYIEQETNSAGSNLDLFS